MTASAEIQYLVDEAAVLRVLSEYCLRLEINTFEEWMDLFTDDTVYEVHRRTLRGRDEVAAMLSQAPKGAHMPGAVRITLDGDTATTVQNYVFSANDEKFSNRGWYYRTLIRTSGGWKISHTKVVIYKPERPAT